jgi:hypothetical protein
MNTKKAATSLRVHRRAEIESTADEQQQEHGFAQDVQGDDDRLRGLLEGSSL